VILTKADVTKAKAKANNKKFLFLLLTEKIDRKDM